MSTCNALQTALGAPIYNSASSSWISQLPFFAGTAVIAEAAAEVQARWIDKLAGVDVIVDSHVRTALIYARWDD
jgi:hypothetical protein